MPRFDRRLSELNVTVDLSVSGGGSCSLCQLAPRHSLFGLISETPH